MHNSESGDAAKSACEGDDGWRIVLVCARAEAVYDSTAIIRSAKAGGDDAFVESHRTDTAKRRAKRAERCSKKPSYRSGRRGDEDWPELACGY